jgi:GH25 family lysozyme M1 (1,4-beta-N-acetylmuramidase)
MSTGRHRRIDWASREVRVRVAAVTACAALVAGALSVYGVTKGSGSGARVRATELSGAPAPSLPPASPAEGHSPRLTRELSGPLSKTGLHRSGSGVVLSATATAAATSTLLNGIDVASFQHPVTKANPNGAPIDWTQVAGAGYKFAAIKATEGTHVNTGGFDGYYANPFYVGDAQAATAAGMYVAAYHFANPFNSGGAFQADLAAQYAGEAQNTAGTDYKVGGMYLPLMLDLEYNPYAPADGGNQCYGLTPSAMVSWVSSFVAEATTDTGAAPIIYTPPNWWAACTGNSTAFGGDLLWVPSFSVNAPSTLPAGWNTWNFWQYSSGGTVPGFDPSATVDLDYFSGGAEARQTAQGASVSVQIQALSALAGQPVTYSAAGLPPGVTMSSGGLMTGAPSAAGLYQVTVTAQGTGTVVPASFAFSWQVLAPPAVAVGAEGTDGQLWVQAPQLGGGWHPLGGRIVAAPAVVAPPNADGATPAQPLFIGTGTDKQLWIRSVTAGWQPIGVAQCVGGPAAIITGTTLTVACRGTDNALWYNTATVPSSGLPAFTGSWRSLGGVLSAGPAAAPVGSTLTFFVRGTSGAIYTRTVAAGYAVTPWSCAGQPAAALQAATGTTTFACNSGGALWESANSGSGWTTAVSGGGSLLSGPAVAATTLETDFLAEGTDHAIWELAPAGWSSLGGQVNGGVGAAALN